MSSTETTTFAYDTNNNVIEISGPRADQHKEITYDLANRPIRITETQTDGSLLVWGKQYNTLGQVISETDPCGNTTSYSYDALGRVTTICYPDGAILKREYDPLGNIIKETDPEGYVTTKSYNAFSQPLSIHYPDGSEEHFTYYSTGMVNSHLDKNGATILYTYDVFDHLIKEEMLSSSGKQLKVLLATWSAFQKLAEVEDDLITTYSYDFAGRNTAEQRAYKKTLYTYDEMGRLKSTQNEDVYHIQEYDLAGRLIQTRVEKGDTLQKQEAYAYDTAGNRTEVINSQGITKTLFNCSGKPLCVEDALGFATHYAYLYKNEFTQIVTNPKGIQTLSVYDSRGRETIRIKKNSNGEVIQSSVSSYDKNGNLTQLVHTVFSGAVPIKTITHSWEYGPMGRLERFVEAGEKETHYLYDKRGRLQTLIKPDGTHIKYEYDELGHLARYYAHDFDYRYTYDRKDRLIEVFDVMTNAKTLRSYDPLGNILEETLSNNTALCHRYDTQGRKVESTLPDSSKIIYSYNGIYLYSVLRGDYTHTYNERNLEGLITGVTLPAHAGNMQINRDALGRFTKLSSPYFQSTYTSYDFTGNLTFYSYQDSLGQAECHYTYDELDQLIAEDDHSYQFDSLYNRLKKDSYNYNVNDLCQITDDGEISYVYDLCGNLISDGARTYTYDSQDRLIAVKEGDQKTEYTYDPFHRRLSKIYTERNKRKVLHYLWDGNNEIGAADEKGKIQQLRILGEGLGAEIGAAVFYELNGKTYVPLHDHRGCVVTVVDPAKQVPIESYRYSAFGEELTESTLSPWRFSSKRVDEETGLTFFGRRYYNPTLGRFITQDPQGFVDGPNLYAFLHNAPLVDIDPYGLFSKDQCLDTALNCCGVPGGILKFFGFGKPQEYTRFELDHFSNKSYNSSLGLRELPLGEIGRTNGIFNNDRHVIQAAKELSRFIGGYNVHYTHNETHGVFDLHEAAMNLYGKIATDPVLQIQKRWYSFAERSPPDVPYYEEGHSGGVTLIGLALAGCPEDIRKRIIVRAFAPASYISPDLCRSVRHYVSSGDFVHKFDFKGRKEYVDTIIVLPRHPKVSKFLPDHSISSPTFSKPRSDEAREYIMLLKEYEKK